jgi:hypothetical protein
MSEVMQRTGFIETLSPMVQTTSKTMGTKLVINTHVYDFKENGDWWNDAELDRLIARGELPKRTVLRNHGHFVCEVTDPEDYEAILSIGAGYRPYDQTNTSRRDPPLPSTIPNTREAAASATSKAPAKPRESKATTPRPGREPDAPKPSFDPAQG